MNKGAQSYGSNITTRFLPVSFLHVAGNTSDIRSDMDGAKRAALPLHGLQPGSCTCQRASCRCVLRAINATARHALHRKTLRQAGPPNLTRRFI